MRWTRPGCGIGNALFLSAFSSVLWGVTVLAWGLLVRGIYRWRGWRRFRASLILGPGLFLCGWLVIQTVRFPPTAAGVFHQRTGVRLPPGIRNLQWSADGGGFDGFAGVYAFEVPTAAATGGLIRDLDLKPESEAVTWRNPGWRGVSAGFADREKLTAFSAERGFILTTLWTDSGRMRVFIIISSFAGKE